MSLNIESILPNHGRGNVGDTQYTPVLITGTGFTPGMIPTFGTTTEDTKDATGVNVVATLKYGVMPLNIPVNIPVLVLL